MDDMTKSFYTSFLNYISPRELKKLYANLSRQKISVNGFPPNKKLPSAQLASQIAKNKKAFFEVLEEFYTTTFDSYDHAAQSFSPDTAVICLAYFVKNGMMDEAFFMSLLETDAPAPEEIKLPQEDGKSKKKAEGFREKYLSIRRELIQLKNDCAKLQTDNAALHLALAEKENELQSIKSAFQQFQDESAVTVNSLKMRVRELENSIIEYQSTNTVQMVSILALIGTDESDKLGIDILTYDNISKLFEIADKYDEILSIKNDLPFSVMRKIHKTDTIRRKLISFSTKQEMLEYAKQRRNN